MYFKGSSFAIILFLAGMFSWQNDSDAGRRGKGIFFINFANDTIGERKAAATPQDFLFLMGQSEADLPPEADINDLKSEIAGMKVGYKYTYFGLFWLELWTWGGEVVLYKDKTYYNVEIDQAEAVKKYGKPFFYKFPPLLIGVLLFGGFWVMGMMSQGKSAAEKSGSAVPRTSGMGGGAGSALSGGGAPVSQAPEYTEEQLQQMYNDERYQHALQLLEQSGSFQQPVAYLIENGVPEAEAGASLSALKKAVADSQDA